MADIVSTATRSRMMAGIKGKNTKPELLIRKALHRLGYRYRLHVANIPGKPDLVLPRYKALIFIHGCFWHGHNCHLFHLPSTRTQFWEEKIGLNRQRDERSIVLAKKEGWRILVIWECSLRGKTSYPLNELIEIADKWLKSGDIYLQLSGRNETV